MDYAELEKGLRVVESAIVEIKWRLKSSTKRRLITDLLALITKLRSAILVDYGGNGSLLLQNLCKILDTIQKGSALWMPLRVMIIGEMIYLIHIRGLAEHALSSLKFEYPLYFVDLDKDPPKMALQGDVSVASIRLMEIQKIFLSALSAYDSNKDLVMSTDFVSLNNLDDELAKVQGNLAAQPFGYIDLSNCIDDALVTLPTLNGWLLEYPVVYLFSKDRVLDAMSNLSSRPLTIYRIVVRRAGVPRNDAYQDELMSFTVPSELSMSAENEKWAKEFLETLLVKLELEGCKQVWSDLHLEVDGCYPQSVVL